jgi:hypothetical protein
VRHLAGFPTGAVFDADNKAWELLTFVLWKLGMAKGAAFNTFIVLSHLLVAPVVYAGGRLFRLERGSALLAAAAAVLYWNFDGWSHWLWFVGMNAYGMASYLVLLPLGLMYRWMDERRAWQLASLTLSLALCHLVHPYSFFILVVPMLALYVRRAGGLTIKEHAAIIGVALFTVAVNLYWLRVAIRFWPYVLDSSLFAETGISSVVWDLLGVLTDPGSTGIIGKRTAFRTMIVACAIVMAWIWRPHRDSRLVPLGAGMLALAAWAYLGGYTWLEQTQPYRNILPLGFLAVVPAAALVEHARTERLWAGFTAAAKVSTALLGLPTMLYLSSDVLYFTARSLPTPAPLPHGERVSLGPLGFANHADYSYADWNADELVRWVEAHDDGQGRWLVEGWAWGEHLTWQTDTQVLGGFIWRNLEHSWANFFRRRPQGIAHDKELSEYFDLYGVRWVVLSSPPSKIPWWDKSKVIEPVAEVGAFRVYRVRSETSLFLRGSGHVEAQTNEIRVRGTDPETEVILRYHWLETLVCEPECDLARADVPGDTVGFIRIAAPHPGDFVIRNAYVWPD